MKSFFRLNEYSVLFYRIALAYVFYFIARILFYTYNYDILDVNSVTEFLQISYHGLVFDTTAILYVNGLFILLSTLPFFINTKPKYQKGLFYCILHMKCTKRFKTKPVINYLSGTI